MPTVLIGTAFRSYRNPELEIKFWRSASEQEIDFILADKQLALEIKGKSLVTNKDLKVLRAIVDDGPIKYRVVVSLESQPRMTEDGILILPCQEFLQKLWGREFGV